MKTGVVIRQGRKVNISDGQKACDNWLCQTVFLPIFSCAALIGCVGNLYKKEAYFHAQQEAFAEVENEVQVLPDVKASTLKTLVTSADNIMHFTGGYTATVGDSAFKLRFDHALKLHRHTEYCQWDEDSHDSCEQCTRQDDDGKEETYDCNCVREYSYIKAWRNRLIPSLGFDQPSNHHNPMRDPFPSTDIFSGDVTMGAIQISHGIVDNLRARMDPVTFSVGGQPFKPGFFTRLWHYFFGKPEVRFEKMEQLKMFHESSAYMDHHFVFTNTWEGWFFSAYDMPVWQKALRGFGQWLEGSLLDWQIGDLYDMVNGCTPGDLRSRYYIADPEDISVLGQIHTVVNGSYRSVPYRTSNNFGVGIVHAGQLSPDQLFAGETFLAKRSRQWARCYNLLSGAGAMYLIVHFGLWNPGKSFALVFYATLGISLSLMSLVWAAVYGLSDWTGADSDIWTILVGLCGTVLLGLILMQPTNKSAKEKNA